MDSAPAHAGIVNVQSILATEAKEGLSGSITGSIDWRTGNVRRLWLNLAPVARYRTGDHLFIGLASGEFLNTPAPLRGEYRIFEHLRYRYNIRPRFIGEVFGQHEQRFLPAKHTRTIRAIVGAGPRYQVISSERTQLGVGAAYMFEYERLDRDDPETMLETIVTEYNHRISSYMTGSYELKEDFLLVATFYAQPKITDPGDIKLLTEGQIVLRLSKRLSFRTTVSVAYDAEPLDTVEPLDTRILSAITYEF